MCIIFTLDLFYYGYTVYFVPAFNKTKLQLHNCQKIFQVLKND